MISISIYIYNQLQLLLWINLDAPDHPAELQQRWLHRCPSAETTPRHLTCCAQNTGEKMYPYMYIQYIYIFILVM